MFVILTLLLVWHGSLTDSLICFQCSASSNKEPCVTDWEGMANASTRHIYAKNCTAVPNKHWTRCMIQSMKRSKGGYTFYQRDCHDGVYFPKELNSSRFRNQPPYNQTTCDIGLQMEDICYTSCDSDFCNGPQLLPEITTNCTDSDSDYDVEGCGARGIFARNELLVTELLALVISVFVTRYFMSLNN